MTNRRQIIICDNQPLTAFAVEALCHEIDTNASIYYASNKCELGNLLRQTDCPVAVILDYTLFDFSDREGLIIMSEANKQVSWLLLSDDLTADFLRYVLYGSQHIGVCYKDSALDILKEALHYTIRGERYIAQHAADILQRQTTTSEHTIDSLTQTEREVLKSIALGKTTKEIAAERFSSIHTINSHRKNIFRKLNVNCAHDAMKYAFRAGLVDETEFYI